MKKTFFCIAAGLLATVSLGGIAVAQNIEAITVTSSRIVNTRVDPVPMHLPITSLSLSYGVSLAGLNLATPAGAAELEKRVNDAALAACKEISRQYPHAKPDDATCAKAAVKDAMVKVREAVAAAGKEAAK